MTINLPKFFDIREATRDIAEFHLQEGCMFQPVDEDKVADYFNKFLAENPKVKEIEGLVDRLHESVKLGSRITALDYNKDQKIGSYVLNRNGFIGPASSVVEVATIGANTLERGYEQNYIRFGNAGNGVVLGDSYCAMRLDKVSAEKKDNSLILKAFYSEKPQFNIEKILK
ncbi:MAG: hypothetical protein KKF50_03130 [Nanoarchaeota archaeon]|nr:hypothetical protein [Nanoarchaeota archaeon]